MLLAMALISIMAYLVAILILGRGYNVTDQTCITT